MDALAPRETQAYCSDRGPEPGCELDSGRADIAGEYREPARNASTAPVRCVPELVLPYEHQPDPAMNQFAVRVPRPGPMASFITVKTTVLSTKAPFHW